jgi:YHS domain-containing protein
VQALPAGPKTFIEATVHFFGHDWAHAAYVPKVIMKRLILAASVCLVACNTTPPTAEPRSEAVAHAAEESVAAPASQPSTPAQRDLTLVTDAKQVCMVNNQFMGREQIPVQVEGKTYFGCCEMCKGRLERDPSSRSAKDPVSGKLVDKATAVIGRRVNDVLYFENRETFDRFKTL